MRIFKIYFAFTLLLCTPSQANHEEWWILGTTTATLAGATAGVWFGMDSPSSCKWCEPNQADIDTTESLQWNHPDSAELVSDIVAYGVMPAASLATIIGYSVPEWERFGHHSLILGDTVLLTLFVTTLIKKAVARQRPESFHNHTQTDDESYQSFPSGHTSIGFALSTIATAFAYRQNSRLTPYLATTGFALSAFTGYLRIAALKHWMSDVFVGAGLGVLTGLIPTALFRALPEPSDSNTPQ